MPESRAVAPMAGSIATAGAVVTSPARADIREFDVLIIGAGPTGLFLLHRLRQLGLSVRVFEAGGGVGGVWYWNRYPGARLDSESYTYGYAFSDDLLQEWDWSEHFASQPENERYFNYVADKFDLRPDIELNATVTSAVFDEADNRWLVRTEGGGLARTRFLIAAVGLLTAPNMPDLPGIETFAGPVHHTARWPHEPVDLTGKRVAVFGTGASGVQVISAIAGTVEHLTVFQRTPSYCAPMRNATIDPDTQRAIKAGYPELIKKCRESAMGFMFDFDPRSALGVSPEERRATFDELWAERGFKKWLGNFHDIMTDESANETFAEYVRERIRERIHDPEIARKLVPVDYPLGAKRIPLESGYYEVYNRDDVTLVDLRESTIERVVPDGIETSEGHIQLDVIIFATGFDALTGALTRIDIRGEGGQAFKDKWADGPASYLGLQCAGFPNFFIAINASLCNYPRCIENIVDWITDCVEYLRQRGIVRIAPTPQAEAEWMAHRRELSDNSLLVDWASRANSWFVGANVPGKKRELLFYMGTNPAYRKKCADVAANGYEGFVLSQ